MLATGLLRPSLTADHGLVFKPAPSATANASWVAAFGLASLVASHPGRVRRCGLPQCGCYFVDISRSGRRRWCAMALCGNRVKARRHYHRARG
ncbi:MAG: CGNR zinc finger domain-containing protein [Thermoplasmata archaeon]|nr:CGNR zinc finger domain-containing protein [Thermoplasmata archaeon]